MRTCTQSGDGVWAELAIEVLRNFGKLRMRAFGSSMVPAVFPGDILTIRRASANDLRKGDIVLCTRGGTFVIHRLIGTLQQNDGPRWITRGDALNPHDPPVPAAEVLGRVVLIERNGKQWAVSGVSSVPERLLRWCLRRSSFAMRLVLSWHARNGRIATKQPVPSQASLLESA